YLRGASRIASGTQTPGGEREGIERVAAGADVRAPAGERADGPDPGGPLGARGGHRDPRQGGLLQRARPPGGDQPRARAHVLQGDGAAWPGPDGAGDQGGGRVTQRREDSKSTRLNSSYEIISEPN